MSGLSNAVIIAEAAEHSGTMATATYALKQSKELYVVPGDINRPNSKGCNKMLENANAYYDFDLFVKLALGMDSKKKRVAGLPVKQQQIAIALGRDNDFRCLKGSHGRVVLLIV